MRYKNQFISPTGLVVGGAKPLSDEELQRVYPDVKSARTWYAKATSSGQGLIIDEPTGANIAVSYDAENAPLLAAAPELFTMLEGLLATAELVDAGNKAKLGFTGMLGFSPDLFAKCHAAIAKAKGDTQ